MGYSQIRCSSSRVIGAAVSSAIKSSLPLRLLPLILDNRPALKHPAEYPFFECGEAGTAACSWSGYVYNLIQCNAACLNQDDAVRQTHGLGDVMRNEHCGKAAASPDVFDELLHVDARERVQ